MENMEALKHMLCRDMDEIARSGKLSGGSLEMLASATTALKNLYKIEMLEEESESHRSMRGSYDEETSGRRGRGRNGRFVSRDGSYDGGSYESYDSYDGGSYGGYSDRGSYGHEEGREHMIMQIEKMMNQANNSMEKEALRRCISNLKRA